MNSRIKKTVLCSMLAAICAIFSQIYIPLPFTPIIVNLATAAVFIAGGVLGPKLGAISMVVYAAVGAVGLPVFSGFRGGLSHLAGPTGGYIIGYIAAALIIGLITSKRTGFFIYFAGMTVGMAVYFTLGTAWFMYSTNTSLGASLVMCVVPFIPGDLLKAALSATICNRVKPLLNISKQ